MGYTCRWCLYKLSRWVFSEKDVWSMSKVSLHRVFEPFDSYFRHLKMVFSIKSRTFLNVIMVIQKIPITMQHTKRSKQNTRASVILCSWHYYLHLFQTLSSMNRCKSFKHSVTINLTELDSLYLPLVHDWSEFNIRSTIIAVA